MEKAPPAQVEALLAERVANPQSQIPGEAPRAVQAVFPLCWWGYGKVGPPGAALLRLYPMVYLEGCSRWRETPRKEEVLENSFSPK